MKKKLLFVSLMVCLFLCLFAVSVSAEDIVANTIKSDVYGTIYQLNQDPGLDNAHLYVSTINNIEDQGKDTESMAIVTDGTYYYVFPSSYLVDEYTNGKLSFTTTMGLGNNYSSNQKGINDAFDEWAAAEGVTLPTFETTGTWGNTRLNFLVRLELPSDVTFIDRKHCLIRSDALVEIRFTIPVNLGGASGTFNGNVSLTTVVDLDKCTNVNTATSMFYNCTSLVSVKVPSYMTTVPAEMFCGCKSFTGIENWDEIKNNVTSIGASAFYNCDSLVSISLPSVTEIGSKAFAYSDAFEAVDLEGAPLVSFGDAFRNCPKLDGLVLPETVTIIGRDSFYGCSSLTYINVPRDCTELGAYAFSGCSKLEVLDMSRAENLKSTGQNTFSGTAIKELIFPEGFESFGGGGNSNLVKIYLPNSVTTMVSLSWASITEFTVPLGVTSLGTKQFDYCQKLQTIIIHKGVTSIDMSNNRSFFGTSPSTVIYTGSENDAIVEQLKTALPNATIVYADQCTTYFGSHAWSGDTKMLPVDYFKEIQFADSCTREFCNVSEVDPSKTMDAIFTYYGYSCTEEAIGGKHSMSQFYGVNTEALEAYTNYTGKSFAYGLVASGTANPLEYKDGELTVAEKAFTKDSESFAHDFFGIKINGMTGENLNKAIVFCAYVIDGDSVVYLDNDATTTVVSGSTYNDVLASLKEEE